MSNVAIMDQRNTTGLTLVLEDDYQVKNMTLLEESLKHIPSDFDVVRCSLGLLTKRISMDE